MQVEDYDRLRQHYARLEDEELRELALVGAETLRPEALELLRSEISRRRMGNEVEAGIQAQLQDLTPDREAELVEHVKANRGEIAAMLHATEAPRHPG